MADAKEEKRTSSMNVGTTAASRSELEVAELMAENIGWRASVPFKLMMALAVAWALTAVRAAAQGEFPPGAQFNAGTAYLGLGIQNGANMAGGYFGNGNGKNFDVAVTNGTGSGPVLSVFLGNGDGTFAAPANYSRTTTGWSAAGIVDGLNLIVAGPVTGPGKQDLVVTDDANNLFVIPGNGDGTFGTPTALNETAYKIFPYLNSSGTLNFVTNTVVYNGNTATNMVQVYLNNASGALHVQTLLSSTTYAVTEADELDIAGTPTVLIVGSDGTAMSSTFSGGVFLTPVSFNLNLPTGTTPISHVTPFSLSGNTGFAAISGNWIFFWIGNSDGSFQTPYQLSVGAYAPVQLGTADLNQDGYADILVLEGSSFSGQQAVIPIYGNSNGKFGAEFETGPGVYGSEFVIGDLNSDGYPDIVLAEGNQGLSVLMNQKNGDYPHPNTFPQAKETVSASQVAPFPVDMVAADLNGDQLSDLVVVNGPNPTSGVNTNSVSVFLNEGNGTTISNGTFASEQIYSVGDQPIAAAVATVNSQPSIFVANAKDTTVSFLQGKGDGTFDPAVTFPSGGLPNCSSCSLSAMAVGSIDKSGFPGVVIAGSNSSASGNLYVFTHGANGWTNTATYAVPAGITSMVLYEATGSGNNDLVVSTAGACQYNMNGQYLADGYIYVYPGKGDGTFGTPTKFTSTLPANATNWNPGTLAVGALTGIAPNLVVLQNPYSNGCISYGATPVKAISIFSNIGGASPAETDLDSPLAGAMFAGGVSGQQVHAAVADVNQDGFNDLVLAENGLIAVIPGTGSTTFGTPGVQVASSDTGGLATGSFFASGTTAGGGDAATASSSGITLLPSLSAGAPYADFSQTTLDYSLVNPGATVPIAFTLKNIGTGKLNVPIFTILQANGDKAPEYRVDSIVCGAVTNPPNISLAAGDECTLTIDFTPPYGGNFPAQIEFSSNAADSNAPTTPIAGTSDYEQIVLLQGQGRSGTPIVISPSTLAAGALNTSYLATFSAIGGSGGYTFTETGALPRGLTFNNGLLSGKPTSAGSFPFSVTAKDSSSAKTTANYTLDVTCPKLAITPASGILNPATVGFIYDDVFTVKGPNGAFKWSLIPTLPLGLKFSGSNTTVATVAGIPTGSGPSSFGLSITDSVGCSVQNNYELEVVLPLKVGPAHLPAATVDKAYVSPAFTATGGQPPYTFLAVNPPPGISMDKSTGKLAGTPTLSGSFVVTVLASDAKGVDGKENVTLDVMPGGAIVIAPAALPGAIRGTAYSETLTATGGGGGYTFTAPAVELPKGIALSKAGLLSGTPTAAGTYPITVTATDHLGVAGTRTYSMVVGLPPTDKPVITPQGGTFTAAQTVKITDATPGSTIYYTTNGTTPTITSKKYSGAFKVTATETVKAIAIASGHTKSALASAKFTIN